MTMENYWTRTAQRQNRRGFLKGGAAGAAGLGALALVGCGESKSEQRLGLTEDAMKHRLRQLTGKGILLAGVIGTDQSKFIRQNARDPMSELRPRPWNCLTGFFKGL